MKVGRSFEVEGPMNAIYEAVRAFYAKERFVLDSSAAPVRLTGSRGNVGGTVLGLKTNDVSTKLSVMMKDLGGRVSVYVEYDIVSSVWLGLGDAPEKHRAALESEISRLQQHVAASVASVPKTRSGGLSMRTFARMPALWTWAASISS